VSAMSLAASMKREDRHCVLPRGNSEMQEEKEDKAENDRNPSSSSLSGACVRARGCSSIILGDGARCAKAPQARSLGPPAEDLPSLDSVERR
jgi:hypothetical protein